MLALRYTCMIMLLNLLTNLAKAEVSVSSTSVAAPIATRQDVYAGELSDTASLV